MEKNIFFLLDGRRVIGRPAASSLYSLPGYIQAPSTALEKGGQMKAERGRGEKSQDVRWEESFLVVVVVVRQGPKRLKCSKLPPRQPSAHTNSFCHS